VTQRLEGVERAIDAFRRGDPVLIHDFDDREAETDLVYPAAAVTPEAVARLRNDAGGLVCVALSDAVAEAFDLPLLEEALDHPSAGGAVAYDDRSSFSISVNHRDTYTGITDEDRSRTVRALAAAADRVPEYGAAEFAGEFRSPGHVTLLRTAPGLLADRQGHTELGVALALAAGTGGAVTGAEMLDADTGGALSPADARSYADEHGLVYVEGSALVDRLA